MLLEPVPLAELPVAEPVDPLLELPVPELLLPVPDPVPVPDIDPLPDAPFGRMRPVISTWLFTYSFSLSFWLPPTSMNLSAAPLVAPDAELPVPVPELLEPVADPLVPEDVPPDMDAEPLPIFALARMYCPALELLPDALDPVLLEPVAEPAPVPDVPAVPAMSALCRHPVTVTC